MEGNGELTYANGDVYSGNFKENNRHGQGKFVDITTNTTYQGEFEADQRHGLGRLEFQSGAVLEGEWVNDSLGSHAWFEGSFADIDVELGNRFGSGRYDGEW